MAEHLSFLEELERQRSEIPTGAEFVAQFDTGTRLSEGGLASELRGGRMAPVDTPAEPVGWEDRCRHRRLRALGI